MKKGFLTAAIISMLFLSFNATAQSKEFIQQKSKAIATELGIDSTQIMVFLIESHGKKALFAQTNNTKFVIDSLAKKLYFGIVNDYVTEYDNICIVQYLPNQTPRTVCYMMDNALFKRP